MGQALDYRSRNISVQNKNILEFIQQLAAGEFLIPTFQRLFVWEADSISRLWDSIYQFYPVGSILCWKTHTRLHVHRQVGGFFIPENGASDSGLQSYILDGQQRATSLMVSFYGGTGKVKEQYAFDYTLYFDLTSAAFFFEKDYYRHRWDAEPEFLLKLRDIPDLPCDHCEQLSLIKGFSPAVERNFKQLQYAFTDYNIPLICLGGYDIEGVCAVFERINQTGVRLKNMDILIARGFKNCATVVEEDFSIIPE
jgi:hypothetical protein